MMQARAVGVEISHDHGQPALRHLQTSPQFQAVMNAGVVASSQHFVLHRLILAPCASVQSNSGKLFAGATGWVGALLPKRHAKKAVRRNLLRRQIYEAAGTFQPTLVGAAHVVRLRRGFEADGFVSASSQALKQAVRTELLALFSKVHGLTAAPSL